MKTSTKTSTSWWNPKGWPWRTIGIIAAVLIIIGLWKGCSKDTEDESIAKEQTADSIANRLDTVIVIHDSIPTNRRLSEEEKAIIREALANKQQQDEDTEDQAIKEEAAAKAADSAEKAETKNYCNPCQSNTTKTLQPQAPRKPKKVYQAADEQTISNYYIVKKTY